MTPRKRNFDDGEAVPAQVRGRIAENRRTRDTSLDLSGCELARLPAGVGKLVWLEGLDLSLNQELSDLGPLAGLANLRTLGVHRTQVHDLGPLAGLASLQTLDVSGTQLSDLGSLDVLGDLQTLNVSGTQVSDLGPLAGLANLRSLSVWSTQVSQLGPLAGLANLQRLIIADTQVSDLGPLAGLANLRSLNVRSTQVSQLGPLAGLANLQTLDVSNTQVSELRALAGLANLQLLLVSDTQVSELGPLAGLANLRTLYASDTQVSELGPLAGLANLQALLVSNTQVSDLGPLVGLVNLQRLVVFNTQVRDLSPLIDPIRRGLPVKWSSAYGKGNGIYVEDCPLTNPPPEIVKQGNEAILNYFAERAAGGVDHLYEAKMLILGEGRAGKTSLLTRLYRPGEPLPKESDTTRGIHISRHDFKLADGHTFRLNVWDFGGQQIYQATHQFFLTHRSLYVLVDDTCKDDKSVSDPGFRDWLERIEVFGGHSPTLIFQNEKGGRSKQIDIGGIRQRYDNVKEVYAGDLAKPDATGKIGAGIEFYAATLSHIGEEVPARWLQVRADIEELAAKQPHIRVEKYFEIYGRHIEFDETKALLLSRYLHDLGVFLHFQDDLLLRRTVILQNQWATDAVFRILDDEGVKQKLGRFTLEDCARLWTGPAYDGMIPELLALMQNFELCYELPLKMPRTWLAPQLLPAETPAELKKWGRPEDLVLRYKYDFLPKGMISRLTVRLHRFVPDAQMAWVTGVRFEREGTEVLAQVLPKGDEIELRARGPEAKELRGVIAADLDALNDSFQGLRGKGTEGLLDKVDRRIPCHCEQCRAEAEPEFFDEKALRKRRQDNRLQVECPRSYEMVDVLELLEGIKLGKQPEWAGQRSPGAGGAAASPREIRIFLASSKELRADRDAFELYFLQQNRELLHKGVQLKVERWENLVSAMSKTRSQDEYNKVIRECDLFVSLFSTKAGEYTVEEFDVAYRQFKSGDKPLVYTFFKDTEIKTGSAPRKGLESLWAFQDRLKQLEHFYDTYESIDELKLRFRNQLDQLLADGRP